MDETVEDGGLLPLTERNINRIEAIENDAPEDRLRLQQMLDIDDDLQSIIDEQIAARERWEEENEDPQAPFAIRQLTGSMNNGVKKDDMQKLENVMHDDENKREHDIQVQNQRYENVTKHYINRSLHQHAQDLRQRKLRNEKQYMGIHKTERDDQRHRHQEHSHRKE
eukprot:8651-Amphidinium_carterae.1